MAGDVAAGSRQPSLKRKHRPADQKRPEDGVAPMGARRHPFDWWDLVLFMLPIAAIVLTMCGDASW